MDAPARDTAAPCFGRAAMTTLSNRAVSPARRKRPHGLPLVTRMVQVAVVPGDNFPPIASHCASAGLVASTSSAANPDFSIPSPPICIVSVFARGAFRLNDSPSQAWPDGKGIMQFPIETRNAREYASVKPRGATMSDVIDCDVVIQAGHEDTPDSATGGEGPLGREIDWTPIVANEAVRVLKAAGVAAVKETAHIKVTKQHYRCKLALFIHFDAPDSGEAGPSVGYDHASDAEAAEQWKTLYKEFFPFPDTWRPDNATDREKFYYAFKYTATSDAEFLIEFGDLQSLRQSKWLKPRLVWLGQLVAHFVSSRIRKGKVPKP